MRAQPSPGVIIDPASFFEDDDDLMDDLPSQFDPRGIGEGFMV